jgi:hypothetical protein
MHGSDFMEIYTARMRVSGITGGKILVQDHLVKFWIELDLAEQEKLSIYDHAWDKESSF